jgi:hypothetical protein
MFLNDRIYISKTEPKTVAHAQRAPQFLSKSSFSKIPLFFNAARRAVAIALS